MSQVDIANLRFDFDLTFAVLLMHPDGTVYHRYGGRGPDAADDYLSMTSLTQLLIDTLPEHRAYGADPKPPARREPQPAIAMPALQQRLARGQKIDCVHCHTVHDIEHEQAVAAGSWQRERAFRYPDPERIGVTLDAERQHIVVEVHERSPARAAGVEVGDALLSLGSQRSVRTFTDVQWALDQLPFGANRTALLVERDGEQRTLSLELPDGWKVCEPTDYAWRPLKWRLSPSPGFGGPLLSAPQKRRLGLPKHAFAMRVGYIVDWGDKAHRGRAVKKAGLKKGDVVIGYGGRRDFRSFAHLHAWVVLTREVGEEVEIRILRDGRPLTLTCELPE